MKLEKAIKILRAEQKHGVILDMDDWNNAIELGIEALEREQTRRKYTSPKFISYLPGETEGEKNETRKSHSNP